MLVYCAGGLLSKLISRGSWPVVGNFSLVVICIILSNCGRVQLIVVAGDSKLIVVFMGLSSCGEGISVLEVVGSSLFISGSTYQYAAGAQDSSKRGLRILSR